MASHPQHWLVTVALVTSSLIALVANLLLLLVFSRRRGLRTVSNRFTINLLITNLLSSILLIPLLIVDQEVSPAGNAATTFSSNDFEIVVNEKNSSSHDIIVEEFREDEIIESGLLEEKEKVVIYDKISVNTSVANDSDYLNSTNEVLCYLAQSTVGLVCTASILSVLLIGIDQYFAVIHSLRYHSYIDKFRSMVLIVTSWLTAIFFAILGGLTQNQSNFWRFCSRNFNESRDAIPFEILNSIYAVMYFIFVILLPFIAICAIYVCIYSAARKNSERMRKSTKGNSQSNLDTYAQMSENNKVPSESKLDLKMVQEENGCEQGVSAPKGLIKVQSAPNFSNLVEEKEIPHIVPVHTKVKRTCSERVGFITNLKCKISNASVFRYREETRAAKISILVIFMVLVCYIPYGFAVVLNSKAVAKATPIYYNYISLVLLVFSNAISPFLFAYRNRRIRRELLRFLGIVRAKNVSNSLLRKNIARKSNAVTTTVVQKNNVIAEECNRNEIVAAVEPFLDNAREIPQVIVTCKIEGEKTERASILKRVCSTKNWSNYKKCSFITVPESCWQTDSARGSFSSASTQISVEDG